MKTIVVAVALIAASLVARTARADGRNPLNGRVVELQVGTVLGGMPIADFNGFAAGGELSIGLPLTSRLSLRGHGSVMGYREVTENIEDAIGGTAFRYGVGLRWRFLQIGGKRDWDPIRVAFYGEGGIGHQKIYWDAGGKIDRNDASIGTGLSIDFKIGRGEKVRMMGIYTDVHMLVAKAPGKEGAPGCTVVCDEPTPPYPWDIGAMVRIGFTYGF